MGKIVTNGLFWTRTFLLLSFVGFCSVTEAAYPTLYSAIGTPIFQAAEGYERIVDNEHFVSSKTALMKFVKDANGLKAEGLELDKSGTKEERMAYLRELRELAQMNKPLERDVLQSIRILKAKKHYAELSALAENPSPVICSAASYEPQSTSAANGSTGMPLSFEALQSSLVSLRQELDRSRERKTQDVSCLNDITAINYLMVRAETFKRERQFCKAHDTCEQIVEYEYTARKSCGKEDPRYQKWSSASLAYRTDMMALFKDACRR